MQPQAAVSTSVAPAASTYAVSGTGYAGFWIRFLAVVLDSIIVRIVTIPFAALLGVFGVLHHPNVVRGRLDESDVLALVAASATLVPIILCISWLYEASLTSSTWQGTVGKKLLNLKVIDEAGNRISFLRATGRHFAKYYLSSILLIGFIMAAFTERKRALHDFIAGTLVKKG